MYDDGDYGGYENRDFSSGKSELERYPRIHEIILVSAIAFGMILGLAFVYEQALKRTPQNYVSSSQQDC